MLSGPQDAPYFYSSAATQPTTQPNQHTTMNITNISQFNLTNAKVQQTAEATFITFPKVEHRTRCIAGVLESKLESTTIIAICIKDRAGLQADRWTIKAVDIFTGVGMQDRPLYDGEWANILA